MATKEKIPITPEILTWARRQFNMTTEYVAQKIRVKEEQILSWEEGTASPTYSQLENLAKIYRKPVEIFFYPKPPEIPVPDIKLRALYGEYLQDTPTELLIIMNNAEIIQNNLRELCQGKNPAEKLITRQKYQGSILDYANSTRDHLNAPLTEQTAIQNPDKALKYWREKLADAGIYIFKESFHNTSYSGFCLDDPEFPIIYLNNDMLPQRLIFTIFHELYHLITGKSGIDFENGANITQYLPSSDQITEKACDQFASVFLVPLEDLEHTINTTKGIREALDTNRSTEIKTLCIKPLAKKYSVSQDMILLRLIKAGYLSDTDYPIYRSSNIKEKKEKKDRKTGGIDYATIKIAQLGKPYINLVREKQAEYGFEDYQAAEYLGITTKSLESIEKKLAGVR